MPGPKCVWGWDNSHRRAKDYSAVKVLVWERDKGLWAPISSWVTESETLRNRKLRVQHAARW